MRQAVIANPGLFHGDLAKREIHWFDPNLQAWLIWNDQAGEWAAHSALTGEPLPPPGL
jgi:acrylyl-CoA reductase (NADPH)/3-hydroxypropionyl-CoA dehydratase/3-hydroxypropionyl-CoA synthetase